MGTNDVSNDSKNMESENRDVKSSSKKRPRNRKERRAQSKDRKSSYFKGRGANDLAWHSPDAELLRRSAETSWSFQTGELIDVNMPMYSDQSATPVYASQAGIFVVHDMITCGGAGYLTTANKESLFTNPTYNAANTLLTEMRSRARLRNTYDAPDVFMLTMAMANIYAAVVFAKRLAGTVRMFTYQNQYLPELLIQAQGFDANWFKINQYRFVTELNVLISEINKVYVPNRMHLFELINERFSNYYTEGDSIRDQLYVITPAMFNIYVENGGGGYWASELDPAMVMPGKITNWGTTGTGMNTQYDLSSSYTGDSLLNVIRRMLENVISDSATADITGDMANCFGENDRFYIPPADPAALVVPVFNEEILETIHNATCIPAVFDQFVNYATNTSGTNFKIGQDPNTNSIGLFDCFVWGDKTSTVDKAKLQAMSGHRIIDVHKDPSPEKTFAITRMRNIVGYYSSDNNNSGFYVPVKMGADLICAFSYWTMIMSNGTPTPLYRGFHSLSTTVQSDLVRLEAFHYRPMLVPIDGTSGARLTQWVTGESDIFATIDAQMINNMNRISLLTLLGAYNNI